LRKRIVRSGFFKKTWHNFGEEVIGQEVRLLSPSSHTTAHAVPYTAVHETHWIRY